VTGKYRAVITHDNTRTMPWRRLVAERARDAIAAPIAGPVDITLTFWLPRPPSVSAKRRPTPCCKPDLDKLVRAVLDALSGIAYVDDAQVVVLMAGKRYADAQPGHGPGLWIDVAPSGFVIGLM
jgi:crossover junction endodeoxyribonuclease RusA